MELRIFTMVTVQLCSTELRQLKVGDPKDFIAVEDLNTPHFNGVSAA